MTHQRNGQNKRQEIQKTPSRNSKYVRYGEYKNNSKNNNQGNDLKKSSYYYLLAKAERLTIALEIMTDIENQSHPLVRDLYKDSIAFLSLVGSLSQGGDIGILREARAALVRITSALSVLRHGRVLSAMNCDILRDEYTTLAPVLLSAYEERTEKEIDQMIFDTPALAGRDALFREYEDERSFIEKLEESVTHAPSVGAPYSRVKKYVHEKHIQKDTTHIKDSSKTEKDIQREKQERRKERILQVIREKNQVSIKDISKEVRDCSEKTIQRELVALVSQGILKREGERRWSTYSFA